VIPVSVGRARSSCRMCSVRTEVLTPARQLRAAAAGRRDGGLNGLVGDIAVHVQQQLSLFEGIWWQRFDRQPAATGCWQVAEWRSLDVTFPPHLFILFRVRPYSVKQHPAPA
jgi:hypothetical protein